MRKNLKRLLTRSTKAFMSSPTSLSIVVANKGNHLLNNQCIGDKIILGVSKMYEVCRLCQEESHQLTTC